MFEELKIKISQVHLEIHLNSEVQTCFKTKMAKILQTIKTNKTTKKAKIKTKVEVIKNLLNLLVFPDHQCCPKIKIKVVSV